MNNDTLKALRGSIRKWQRIVEWRGSDEGFSNCPLCAMFAGAPNVRGACADECPVKQRTGKNHCNGTPYYEWIVALQRELAIYTDSYFNLPLDKRVIGPKTQRAAEHELAFLISLLPEKE